MSVSTTTKQSVLKDFFIDGYLPTIGIECHVQLKSATKLFTGVENDARHASPNSLVGPLCLGLPGTLPVLNHEALDLAIRAGIALNAEIAEFTKFDRKHYFYPDLPLGYQISQFDKPIVKNGSIEIETKYGLTDVGIERAHLEADAGKLSHPSSHEYSLVDLNRAGTPLLEIVSRPDMHSAVEAKAYARELYLRMLYADVSDCDLYHGNIRFDVNVSISDNPQELGIRTETKNLNSFRNVEKAVDYEINRQLDNIKSGQKIVQETRGWDDSKQQTFTQRSKEDAHDYRYMPDPDIPPIIIKAEKVAEVKSKMPLGPSAIRQQLSALSLTNSQIETILDNIDLAHLAIKLEDSYDSQTAKTIINWLTGEILRLVNSQIVNWQQVSSAEPQLVELAKMTDGNLLSSGAAKELLHEITVNQADPQKLAETKNLIQVSDEAELIILVEKVISDNPKALQDAKDNRKSIGFLVGQVMRASAGKANPKIVNQLLNKYLED